MSRGQFVDPGRGTVRLGRRGRAAGDALRGRADAVDVRTGDAASRRVGQGGRARRPSAVRARTRRVLRGTSALPVLDGPGHGPRGRRRRDRTYRRLHRRVDRDGGDGRGGRSPPLLGGPRPRRLRGRAGRRGGHPVRRRAHRHPARLHTPARPPHGGGPGGPVRHRLDARFTTPAERGPVQRPPPKAVNSPPPPPRTAPPPDRSPWRPGRARCHGARPTTFLRARRPGPRRRRCPAR